MDGIKFGDILRKNSDTNRDIIVEEFIHEFEDVMDQELFFEASLGRKEFTFDPSSNFRDEDNYSRFKKYIELGIENWLRKEDLKFRKGNDGQYTIFWEVDQAENDQPSSMGECLSSIYKDILKLITTDFYEYFIAKTKEALLSFSDKGLYECECCIFDLFEDYLKEKAVTMADHIDTIWSDRNKEYYAFVKEWAEGEAINIQIMINTKTDKEYIRFSW